MTFHVPIKDATLLTVSHLSEYNESITIRFIRLCKWKVVHVIVKCDIPKIRFCTIVFY